jgi:CubicO group peptidase (beta-lactamase class C family)
VSELRWRSVEAIVGDAVAQGIAPAAALVVARGREILFEHEAPVRQAHAATIFDLSSLTKPLATAAACMVLVARGRLGLDERVVDRLPAFAGHDEPARARVRVCDLLGHRSGLPAWKPFYETAAMHEVEGIPYPTEGSRRAVGDHACRLALESAPGGKAVYSDVGYIVLGMLVEAISGQRLDAFVARELLAPLRLHDTGFLPVTAPGQDAGGLGRTGLDRDRIAPCGHCSWRGCAVHAVVHDLNAYAMGGVAGHAGLFASARDVHALVAEHVAAASNEGEVLDGSVVREFWSPQRKAPGQTWLLGWDTPTPGASSAGSRVSGNAVGHLGFTGTSVWVDRRRGIHVVLLTNRVHAGADAAGIKRLRPMLHDAVFEAVDGESAGR